MMWGWWRQWGWHGDDGDNMDTMWGQRGDHGDNEITTNAITFERIKIIEFCLKIWDPWTHCTHTDCILTLHGVNACFIHHLSNVKNYSIGHKSETNQPNPPPKIVILDNLFLHLSTNFEVKIQNTQCYRSRLTFQHLENQHLTAQQTAHQLHTQKSKIG